jgi:hypothetical protein
MTKYCKKYSNEIYIDINNELFLTLENPYKEIDNYLEFKNNQVFYNNNSPFFVHGAGDTYLDNIINKLKYKYDNNNKINTLISKNYYIKNYFNSCDEYTLYIFNRWGQLIFEQGQDTDQFQGKDMKGNEISDGVLFYKLLFQNYEKSGFIHLIR